MSSGRGLGNSARRRAPVLVARLAGRRRARPPPRRQPINFGRLFRLGPGFPRYSCVPPPYLRKCVDEGGQIRVSPMIPRTAARCRAVRTGSRTTEQPPDGRAGLVPARLNARRFSLRDRARSLHAEPPLYHPNRRSLAVVRRWPPSESVPAADQSPPVGEPRAPDSAIGQLTSRLAHAPRSPDSQVAFGDFPLGDALVLAGRAGPRRAPFDPSFPRLPTLLSPRPRRKRHHHATGPGPRWWPGASPPRPVTRRDGGRIIDPSMTPAPAWAPRRCEGDRTRTPDIQAGSCLAAPM
jgi:hypothetical protein